jgi:hypothetical protein
MPDEDKQELVRQGQVLSPAPAATEVEVWKRPKVRIFVSGAVLVGFAAWLGSNFFQLRGYVNLLASRVDLAICTLCLIVWLWIWARNIKNPKILMPSLLTLGLVVVALFVDQKTLPPIKSTVTEPSQPKSDPNVPVSPHSDSKPQLTPRSIQPSVRRTQPKPSPAISISSQKEVASADLKYPYGLEVVVTTTKEVSPTALRIKFSEDISKMYGTPPGMIYTKAQGGIEVNHPNIVFIQWATPSFSVEGPLKVTVFSAAPVRAIGIESVPFNFPLPEGSLKNLAEE